jgi:hypothetical protein
MEKGQKVALVVIGLLPSFWGVNLDRFAAIPTDT